MGLRTLQRITVNCGNRITVMSSDNNSAMLQALAEQYNHPSVRVMARELTHLAQELERGTLAWPASPPALAPGQPAIPHLEQIEETLKEQRWLQAGYNHYANWQRFATSIRAALAEQPTPLSTSTSSEPHPAAVIAL